MNFQKFKLKWNQNDLRLDIENLYVGQPCHCQKMFQTILQKKCFP